MKIYKYLRNPEKIFLLLLNKYGYLIANDEKYVKLFYRISLGKN